MDKTVFKPQLVTERVSPRDLEVRPLLFSGPVESDVWGVFGKGEKGDDIWLATFYDNDEAQAWVIASKTFGQPVLGASIPSEVIQDGAGISGGDETPKAN